MSHVYKVIVIDDEPAARRKLIYFLTDYPELTVVAEAGNGAEAIHFIDKYKPSLVFLDIRMPLIDGLSVANKLEENTEISIVFVTGNNEHAIDAFELDATDYLLKPYDKARLSKTVNRFLESQKPKRFIELSNAVNNCLEQPYPSRVLFKIDGATEVINTDEIQWVESSGNYIKVCLVRTAFIARQTMSAIQSQLDPSTFVRIHRSHIININEVTRFKTIHKGDFILHLKSGVKLKLSRAYKDRFFTIFNAKQ